MSKNRVGYDIQYFCRDKPGTRRMNREPGDVLIFEDGKLVLKLFG